MTATYTFDIYMSLDGYGSYQAPGDWGGYWGKQGPELLARRSEIYGKEQRMVFGANTFRGFAELLSEGAEESGILDPWVEQMRNLPTTVVSSTIESPVDWPDATVEAGDAVEVIAQLKASSSVPLRSHGSVALNRAALAAGLVDVVQVTVFPVISGATGVDPVLAGSSDFDLELLDQRTLDGRTLELSYRPTVRTW